jgi:GxxExxY protein
METRGIADRVRREYGDLTYRIIGAAMTVHKTLGPGFPEVFCQRALAIELGRQGLGFERERPIEVFYDGTKLGDFYLDFLVENCVVVELKAVDQLSSQH